MASFYPYRLDLASTARSYDARQIDSLPFSRQQVIGTDCPQVQMATE
jgi:hypothetical protein